MNAICKYFQKYEKRGNISIHHSFWCLFKTSKFGTIFRLSLSVHACLCLRRLKLSAWPTVSVCRWSLPVSDSTIHPDPGSLLPGRRGAVPGRRQRQQVLLQRGEHQRAEAGDDRADGSVAAEEEAERPADAADAGDEPEHGRPHHPLSSLSQTQHLYTHGGMLAVSPSCHHRIVLVTVNGTEMTDWRLRPSLGPFVVRDTLFGGLVDGNGASPLWMRGKWWASNWTLLLLSPENASSMWCFACSRVVSRTAMQVVPLRGDRSDVVLRVMSGSPINSDRGQRSQARSVRRTYLINANIPYMSFHFVVCSMLWGCEVSFHTWRCLAAPEIHSLIVPVQISVLRLLVNASVQTLLVADIFCILAVLQTPHTTGEYSRVYFSPTTSLTLLSWNWRTGAMPPPHPTPPEKKRRKSALFSAELNSISCCRRKNEFLLFES